MRTFDNEVQVGILDTSTKKIIKIYPNKLKGNFDEIKNTVMTWYYSQECGNEDEMRNYFVDVID